MINSPPVLRVLIPARLRAQTQRLRQVIHLHLSNFQLATFHVRIVLCGTTTLQSPVNMLVWYGRKKKIPITLGMDIIAPCLMIGLGFGRIGCFLNGCCHGAVCDEPYAVTFPYYSNPYLDQFDHLKGPLAPKVPKELIE